mmetsp:Transcript_27277/g.50265  ORF Transcript_27277/g.50265 Transcript_27277/m.50265 type:complete len:280 (+) Transcript_27277:255-1094(+)
MPAVIWTMMITTQIPLRHRCHLGSRLHGKQSHLQLLIVPLPSFTPDRRRQPMPRHRNHLQAEPNRPKESASRITTKQSIKMMKCHAQTCQQHLLSPRQQKNARTTKKMINQKKQGVQQRSASQRRDSGDTTEKEVPQKPQPMAASAVIPPFPPPSKQDQQTTILPTSTSTATSSAPSIRTTPSKPTLASPPTPNGGYDSTMAYSKMAVRSVPNEPVARGRLSVSFMVFRIRLRRCSLNGPGRMWTNQNRFGRRWGVIRWPRRLSDGWVLRRGWMSCGFC